MKPIMLAFAIVLAFAFAWPSGVWAQAKTAAQAQAEAERLRADAAQGCGTLAETEALRDEAKAALTQARSAAQEGDTYATQAAVETAREAAARAEVIFHCAHESRYGNGTDSVASANYDDIYFAFEDARGAAGRAERAMENVGAQAGPFGINAGDEMPPIEGVNNNQLPFAEIVPAPPNMSRLTNLSRLVVYGTEKTGICAVSAILMVDSDLVEIQMESIMDRLDTNYGDSSRYYDPKGETWHWPVHNYNNSGVESITLTSEMGSWLSLDTGIDESTVDDDDVVIAVDYTLVNYFDCFDVIFEDKRDF